MAISIADIQKIRKMTGAGLADCKKALEQTEGDFEKAIEVIREKGKAIAAKRSDRETSNGCVLVKAADGFAAIIALKCETDFVATNKDFVALTQSILDAAVAAKAKSLDEVKALPLASSTVAEEVVNQSGVTGEKMELDGYMFLEGDNVEIYNHMNNNTLCTMVQTNKPAAEQAHNVAMQVAAMKPVALSEADVDPKIIEEEKKVAAQKTKQEQCQKAIDNALRKAGINPAHVDSEDHMESNMAKGWITAEEVAKAKEIIATVPATVNIPEKMLEGIVNGRVNKFYKESCLLNQEFIQDAKVSVAGYLKATDKELTVVAFKRFTLRAD